MIPWLIVRTEHGREAHVYAEVVALGFDAWLPVEVRLTRESPHTKRVREWRGIILPCAFFAAIPAAALPYMTEIQYCRGVWCYGDGSPAEIPYLVIAGHRGALERENAERLHTYQKIQEILPTPRGMAGNGKRKPRPSRCLPKQRRSSEKILVLAGNPPSHGRYFVAQTAKVVP